MIGISNTTKSESNKTKIKSQKKSKIGASKKKFETELTQSIDFEFQGTLDDLMSDLDEQGGRFLDLQSQYELAKYKSLIKKVLTLIQKQSFSVKEKKRSLLDNRAPTITVEKINSKLFEMTEALTKKNPAFNFMKTIEEIRGLIFDLKY